MLPLEGLIINLLPISICFVMTISHVTNVYIWGQLCFGLPAKLYTVITCFFHNLINVISNPIYSITKHCACNNMAANTICWQKWESVILEIKTMLLSRPPPSLSLLSLPLSHCFSLSPLFTVLYAMSLHRAQKALLRTLPLSVFSQWYVC